MFLRRHILSAVVAACAAAFATSANANLDAVPRTSGIITVRGEPHTYLTEGRGEPCIVTGFAAQYPVLLSDRLKEHFQFIYVEFRNSWGAHTGQDISSVTMDTLVEEIDDVRKAFGLERVCLLGHSSPGLVAIEYAARHPDRTSRLILINVHPFWNQELFDTWTSFWESDASPERKAARANSRQEMPDSALSALDPRDAFAMRYTHRSNAQLWYDYSYDSYWMWIGHQFSDALLKRYWDTIVANYNPWDRLSDNTVPMFVSLGRYDFAVPYHLWDEVRDQTPGVTVELFQRSSHFPMLEQTRQFDDALIGWQRRTSRIPAQ